MIKYDKWNKTLRIGHVELHLHKCRAMGFRLFKTCNHSFIDDNIPHMRGYYFTFPRHVISIMWDSHVCYEEYACRAPTLI